MERMDVALQLARLRTVQRWYAVVVIMAAIGFAVSIASYYGEFEPIAVVSAGE